MNRTENIVKLSQEKFDLCIIGAGASGAGCALDAALRGLKVVLIEAEDFSAGTSSRSTKLIHGGVRYLEMAFKKLDFGQLRQVFHGLAERKNLLKNAPHLTQPLALLTPIFSRWEGLYFSIGLKLYDWLAGKKNQLPPSSWLSAKSLRQRIPQITQKAKGAIRYFDGQLDDARFAWALAQTAAEQGAVIVNHLQLIDFQKDSAGKIFAATFRDTISNATKVVHAKIFLNCTGAHADSIRHLANPKLPPRITPSKGVHAVFSGDLLGGKEALLIPKTADGRVVFAVPFQGKTILGTTDEPYQNVAEEPLLLAKEIDFLMSTAQPFFEKKISLQEVQAGFGGLRPLVSNTNSATKNALRDHLVEHDDASNLVSLMGGKWTTYRLMAKDATDVCAGILNNSSPCRTTDFPLVGAKNWQLEFAQELSKKHPISAKTAQHLSTNYGQRANKVLALLKENDALASLLHPEYPYLQAEVVYAVRHEMAMTIRDFLARRIRLEILDWDACQVAAPIVAAWMGKELGWQAESRANALEEYQMFVEKNRQQAGLGNKS